jgi:hypothetical protein
VMSDWSRIDHCPECGAGNPCDAKVCIKCGADHKRSLAEIARRDQEIRDKVLRSKGIVDWLKNLVGRGSLAGGHGYRHIPGEIAYMKKHPPRCLGRFSKPAAWSLRSHIRSYLGANTTAFTPLCECGNGRLGVAVAKEFGPVTISRPRCGKTRTVFDPRQHGYDAEDGSLAHLPIAEPEAIACGECGGGLFQIALGFQYAGETDVLQEETPPRIGPEDLFGWFTVAVRCVKCGTTDTVRDEECA